MSRQVFEGTWEEIERHKEELVGHHLRVTISPEISAQKGQTAHSKTPPVTTQSKVLTGFGAFKGKIGSSEEFAKEKRAEMEREDRSF